MGFLLKWAGNRWTQVFPVVTPDSLPVEGAGNAPEMWMLPGLLHHPRGPFTPTQRSALQYLIYSSNNHRDILEEKIQDKKNKIEADTYRSHLHLLVTSPLHKLSEVARREYRSGCLLTETPTFTLRSWPLWAIQSGWDSVASQQKWRWESSWEMKKRMAQHSSDPEKETENCLFHSNIYKPIWNHIVSVTMVLYSCYRWEENWQRVIPTGQWNVGIDKSSEKGLMK